MKTTCGWLTGSALLLSAPLAVQAADLSLPDAPLFVEGQNIAPLVMLVMGRDHTLYYEAYNDASDLDGDGKLDTYFRPVDNDDGKAIRYYGYFDSDKCYDYQSNKFQPTGFTSTGKCNNEGGGGRWSGNFLNYLTTSRIDALRKVLYGGKHDNNADKITLERSYIPQDAHSWGKSWNTDDMLELDMDIGEYTPLPNSNSYFFANTTLRSGNNAPLLRVLQLGKKKINNKNEIILNNKPVYIWNWVSKERPVADNQVQGTAVTPDDYVVKVEACVEGLLEANCKNYGQNGKKYASTGLLQNYGEGNSPKMYFGLITGSYKNNTRGGVLRAKIGKMDDEIDQNGRFKPRSGGPGIISTLNNLKISKFKSDGTYDNCGWILDRRMGVDKNNKEKEECHDWGNPIGEMLYESLRYFAGEGKASSTFTLNNTGNNTVNNNDQLSLPEDNWDDPFATAGGHPQCAKPVNLVISDLGTSYDSDQIPGSRFNTNFKGEFKPESQMKGLDVSHWTNLISAREPITNTPFFIGEVLGSPDPKGLPTPKTFNELAKVRGLAPLEPTKEGSYYAAGLAYYGHQTDINPREGSQKPQTVVVAMASNLPQIKIRVGERIVTLIPFAKSVGGSAGGGNVSAKQGDFQPTNTIVDYYVESISRTKGTFRINFEDVEQGADHDMDMIVRYSYEVIGGQIKISLASEHNGGSIDQHAGYVISGTTADGLYLDVKDEGGGRVAYYMDTVAPDDKPYPNNARNMGDADKNKPAYAYKDSDLTLNQTRIFTVNPTAVAADFLPSPLYFAAKWGGFVDLNGDGIPQDKEWDADGDGQPDNYFLVTNANNLEQQLQNALDKVSNLARSGTGLSYTGSELTSNSLAFTSTFEAEQWSGDLTAYPIKQGLVQHNTPAWKANEQISAQGFGENDRKIFTMDSDGSKRVFPAPAPGTDFDVKGDAQGLSKTQIAALLNGYPNSAKKDEGKYVTALVNYLRGDRQFEDPTSTVPGINKPFRARNGVLGDNVNSTPVSGKSVDGVDFVIFGANDGMVHVLNAKTGQEIFAYLPSTSYPKLAELANTGYNHRYFVDGTIKIVKTTDKTIAVGTFGLGAKGAWALDLTNLKTNADLTPQKRLLWELTAKNSGDEKYVGYMQNAPAIAKLGPDTSTQWLAVFNNGYNASNDNGALLVVDLLTGDIKKTLDTQVGANDDPTNAQRPNALSEPVIADVDRDGVVGDDDYLYAGDLFGNLWRVKLATSLNNWALTTSHDGSTSGNNPLPLFEAVSRESKPQPITLRPSVARHPQGGVLVFVGTGKYLEESDREVTDQVTQSVYAIWDKPNRSSAITRSNLLQQTLTTSTNPPRRTTSTNPINWTQHQGWYLDLYSNGSNGGERVNSRILVTNQQAAITSMIPSGDICAGGGSGWYMAVNIYNGSNQRLLEHAIKLDRIPSEPVYNYSTTTNGDYQAGNALQTDGGTIINAPTTLYKTGAGSWQRLY